MNRQKTIQIIKNNWPTGRNMLSEALEYLIPELKESEDERIRKWIKKELESKYVVDNIVNNEMADKAFAWLEKQGEQKSANYSVWVGGSEVNDNYLTKEEAEKLAGKYRKDGYEDVAIEKIEQNPAWSENDESIMSNLCHFLEEYGNKYYGQLTLQSTISWLKSLKQRMKGE